MTSTPGISLRQVAKTYDNGVTAVRDVSLDVAEGEFAVLVGPSGCGKSTLLRMIAGLEEVTGGEIHIAGRDVTDVAPPDRDIAMVFQNYALYPHMTVGQNLGFGLKQRKTDKNVIAQRVGEVGTMLGLGELMHRRPAQLSGGQRQRVAIGRALVREPAAFLLDEPLSNLDAKLRHAMRSELARLHGRLGVTTVYVTHDQVEAMTLGDRVVVLRDGVVQQCDHPQALYERPCNLFVAAFIGSPAMNLVDAEVEGGAVHFAGHRLALPEGSPLLGRRGRVILGIRPAAFVADGPRADPDWPTMRVELGLVEHLGDEVQASFALDAPRVTADAVLAAEDADAAGDARLLADDERTRFVAALDGRLPVRTGDAMTLRVDCSQLHAFDPATGDALAVRDAMLAGVR
ncbi:Trehalose import ATP-binding protein SugC [Baekduia alba]|uniref:ABC transporter ATP-binding protein n=1 Tax=Baekduia alba TaxID=2997333 RepID=UPI002340CAE7|nr:sn-glycerol-3-phosphate ABC transporter ATP-binding protein UgpC [Baekduia alba]WCB95357.1 Trehalose import ATP-binding protein SugC [Baekduia alba]